MPFQNYFLFEKFGGNEFFLNAASAKQSWSSTNHIGRFGGLDVILQRSLDHKERYVGSLFRVDEPVPDDSGKSGDLQSAKAQLNTWRSRNLIDYDDTEGLIKKVKQKNS